MRQNAPPARGTALKPGAGHLLVALLVVHEHGESIDQSLELLGIIASVGDPLLDPIVEVVRDLVGDIAAVRVGRNKVLGGLGHLQGSNREPKSVIALLRDVAHALVDVLESEGTKPALGAGHMLEQVSNIVESQLAVGDLGAPSTELVIDLAALQDGFREVTPVGVTSVLLPAPFRAGLGETT
jgi:hypothetical protein